MRPRPEDRGEPAERGNSGPALQASMRPRPEDRGEQHPQRLRGAAAVASMRPRPEDRGEPAVSFREPKPPDCFNAATARRPWRTTAVSVSLAPATVLLQCGHGQK